MKFTKLILMIGAVAMLGACSDSDDPKPAPQGLNFTVTPNTIKNDGQEAATFTLTNDGVNVTADAKIYMDGQTEPLASASFTSTTVGRYSFHAVYEEETSNTVTVTVNDGETPKPAGEVILTRSTNMIKNDGTESCHFTVTNDGEEITSGVVIYMNDQTELPSFDFTSTEVGTYTFFATYGTAISPEVTVQVVSFDKPTLPEDPNPSSTDFKQRTMAIQFTGLGCMFCPYTIAAVDKIMESDFADNVFFPVAHSYQGDPMGGKVISALAGACGASGAPHISIALRQANYGNTRNVDVNVSTIKNQVNDDQENHPVKAAVSAAVNKEGDQIVIHTNVKAAAEGDYYVGAWLLEDGIAGKQYNPENVSGDFDIHNNVIRDVAGRTGSYVFSGDPLGKLAKGESKTYLQIINLDSKWSAENCKVVVFVSTPDSEGDKPYVNNCAVCEIGGTVAFQYK